MEEAEPLAAWGWVSVTPTAVLGQPVSTNECEPPLRTLSACSPAQDMATSQLTAQRGGGITTESAPYNGDEALALRQRVRVLERQLMHQQESLHMALTEANAKRSEAEVELEYVRSHLEAAAAAAQKVAEAQEEARATAAAAAQKVAEAQEEARATAAAAAQKVAEAQEEARATAAAAAQKVAEAQAEVQRERAKQDELKGKWEALRLILCEHNTPM